ncbi:MAG TPA: hypothetical protein VJQ50_02105 [Terriglobales bacterium]|nr:hypothetical protein [Terriglobales bacterium]
MLFLTVSSFAQFPTPVAQPVGPEHDNPLARELWFRKGRVVPGKPGAAAQFLRRAYQQKMQLRAAHLGRTGGAATSAYSAALTTATPSTASTSNYGGWVPLGPAPINSNATGGLSDQNYGPVTGRATSVVVDPGDPTGNTVYLGGAYGGLWKSTNAAASNPAAVTWTPLIDQQATLAVGSVAVQPSSSGPGNVVLVGTGEADFSIDSYYGLGILRSADGGNTWTIISSAGSALSGLAFAKIAFSTDNPSLVVAAATGAGNDEGATNAGGGNAPGLFTSTDGGQTWAQTQFGVDRGLGATSVIYDPASHKFFAFLQFEGYYVSADGITWGHMANQPGTALHNCPIGNTGVPVCLVFRGEMAAVPGREELYAWYVTIDQRGNIGDGGIYKTTNAGGSWQQVSDSGITNCGDGAGNGCGTEQGWFNLTLAAVPNGAGTDLYAGAVNLYKCSITASNSLCATRPFINLTHVYGCTPLGSLAHVHPDQHGISFLRLSSSQVIMYFANDGGIYRALNGYALNSGTCGAAPNPFQDLNATMGSMSQFVDFADAPGDPGTLLGGTQDNGSPATDTSYGSNWISVNGGDGGFNAIDPSNPQTWFTTNTDVSVQRCNDGINCLAQTFDPIVTNSTVGGDHGFFYTPFILDPQADSRMMVGTCRLWRGNSDGSGFAALSYDFDSFLNQLPSTTACTGNEGQIIRSIAAGGPVTTHGSSVIYVGTEGDPQGSPPSGGTVWVTNNADLGPSTWTATPVWNPFQYPVSSIAVDPGDPSGSTAYATAMGFGTGNISKTTNQGLGWTQVGLQLPNAPVNAIVIDPDDSNTVYVGTDVGVYSSHDLQKWTELGQLPSVAVLQLHMFESGGVKQLRAGTYGRGIWSYDIPYQIRITTPHVYLFPGQTGTINGIITGYNGYSSPVDIECPSNVSFGTCTGMTVTPMPSGTAFSLSVTAGTAPQDSTLVLQGTGTDPNATVETAAPMEISVVDYSLNVQPSTLAANQGGNSSPLLVALSSLGPNVVGEPINISCSNLPPGATCNFFPSATAPFAIPVDGTFVNVTVSVPASAPTGTSAITVKAEASGQPSPKTASVSFTVGSAPDYVITANTPTLNTVPGSSANVGFTLTPAANAYSGPINLSCSADYRTACSLSPGSSIMLNGGPLSVTVAVSVAADMPDYPPNSFTSLVTLTATAPGLPSHSAFADVTVMDFGMTPRNWNAFVNPGQAAQYELFIQPSGPSFTNPVSFSCSNLPAGSRCSFSPPAVTPNSGQSSVIVTITTAKTSAALRPPAAAAEAQLLLALLLPGAVVVLSRRGWNRNFLIIVLLMVLLATVMLQPSCGGGGSSSLPPPSSSPPPPPPPPAPTQVTYNVVVNAVSGPVQHQIPLNLVVVTP